MKSLIVIFLATILICMVDCSPTRKDPSFIIGLSQPTMSDYWRQTMVREMERELLFHPSFELIIRDAKDDNATQIDQINELVGLGIDLLIVSPNESEPISETIENVYNNGIPVIVIDRSINSNAFNTYIGADNFEIGKIAGQYVLSKLKDGGNIIEIWGLSGSSPALNRHNGFKSVVDQVENIKIIQSIDGAWQENIAKNSLQDVSIDWSNVDLIFAHNDPMARAANSFLQEANVDQEIFILGVDALPGPTGGIQMILDDQITASFLYPTGGEEAVNTAIDILSGREVPKNIILETTVVDESNARIMKLQGDKLLNQQEDIERQNATLFTQSQTMRNQRFLAIMLTILSVALLVLAGIVLYQLGAKQKVNLKLEAQNAEILKQRNEMQILAEQKEKATKEKVEFFTNISHEFKTPLTLIMAPVEELLSKSNMRNQDRDQLRLVYKNSQRMHRLISQLMDFRKIETNRLRLYLEKTDIIDFVTEIMAVFSNAMISKDIDFKLISQIPSCELQIDREKIDKVLFNLFSNAFKFTKQGGFIHVSIAESEENDELVIKVSDNGRGMSKEHVDHAFDRFYQGENYSSKGTGLGLSLSRKLINLHQGTISVTSEKGIGSTFTIRLPKHLEVDEELIDRKKSPQHEYESKIYSDYLTGESNGSKLKSDKENNIKDDSILIIEDNEDLGNFLKAKFRHEFQIVHASTGEQGIKLAEEIVPDLIICDLMLPGIQGDAVVNFLKENIMTSHIPIIMLTARDNEEQKSASYTQGVYDYITKPFNTELLVKKVKSIFKNLKALRQYYSSHLVYDANKKKLDPKERNFLQAFDEFVLTHFSDPNLQIETICRHLGVSRVQLYRKLKALAGITVNDYIQGVRIEKAKEMLSSTQLSLSEISYKSGFNSASYFSTSFKNSVGMTPSEWKKNI